MWRTTSFVKGANEFGAVLQNRCSRQDSPVGGIVRHPGTVITSRVCAADIINDRVTDVGRAEEISCRPLGKKLYSCR